MYFAGDVFQTEMDRLVTIGEQLSAKQDGRGIGKSTLNSICRKQI
jgi:hypothetical protein